MKKHKAGFLRDVRFYLSSRHRFNFTGTTPVTFEYSPTGTDGLRAFKKLDSQGVKVPTRHPNIAESLCSTKASVNLHIALWKDGAKDLGFTRLEMSNYLQSINAPQWVADALGDYYSTIKLPKE